MLAFIWAMIWCLLVVLVDIRNGHIKNFSVLSVSSWLKTWRTMWFNVSYEASCNKFLLQLVLGKKFSFLTNQKFSLTRVLWNELFLSCLVCSKFRGKSCDNFKWLFLVLTVHGNVSSSQVTTTNWALSLFGE